MIAGNEQIQESSIEEGNGISLFPGQALSLVRKEMRMGRIEIWKKRFFVAFIVLISVASGVVTNVSFFGMARKMNGTKYAPFYLYFMMICYSIIYGIIVLVRSRKQLKLEHWKWYLTLGIFVSIGSIMSQFSNPFVSGSVQSLLTLIVLPGTAIGNRLFLKRSLNFLEMFGISIVLIGQVFAVLPSMIQDLQNGTNMDQNNSNNFFACIFFLLGALFYGSAVDVVQQKVLFPPYEIDLWVQLFFSSIVASIISIFSIFLPMISPLGSLSVEQISKDQIDSFHCFFQVHPLPEGCSENAQFWGCIFLLSSLIYYYMQSYLIKMEDAIFQGVVLAIIVPISCLLFSIPFFGGEEISFFIIISLVLVMIGVIVFKAARTKCNTTTLSKLNKLKDRFVIQRSYGTNQ